MGIPKMFRFLTDRYPLIMQGLDEGHVFDHFYLDMNGIIHQCTHPNDDKIAIQDIDQMFARIFHYTERLFRIVAPTTLMFLAVDGVAPRAKMNQQRSRRFRSAKEAERAMAETVARGDDIPSGIPFDSNCITPGTKFMYDLSIQFRRWIHEKMSTDPAWQQGCTVVFSGSEVPGEGEHKIMDYIRNWKASENYSPEIRHCMYGLDADLMMLGLVAHAPHFTLIREKMRFTKGGRKVPKMRGTASDADEFQLLEIAMLRDMLFLEFKRKDDGTDPFMRGRRRRSLSKLEMQEIQESANADGPSDQTAFKYEASRVVDDFVFMCMLVGNDFIPNLPHLDIAEGAINIMFRIYKDMLPGWGGYLTDRHRLHPDRLESFVERLSQTEMPYFKQRGTAEGIAEYGSHEYRREYYRQKFQFDVESDEGPQALLRLRQIYMEGLHWVLQYYHNGVSSWNWFYPDFYALLTSDMAELRSIKVGFQKGRPFKPLTQLMAVLPPESAGFLPQPMRTLMTDPNSPVVDFYPTEFFTDPNGKRNAWEAIVVVPFIEENRLLNEVNSIDKETELTEEERKRNEIGPEYWFYAKDYPFAKERTMPVRPSKFYVSRSRSSSRSSSPRGDGNFGRGRGSRSRSSSPREQSSTSEARQRQNWGSNRESSGGSNDFRSGSNDMFSQGRGRGRGRGRGNRRGGPTRGGGQSRGVNRDNTLQGEKPRGRSSGIEERPSAKEKGGDVAGESK